MCNPEVVALSFFVKFREMEQETPQRSIVTNRDWAASDDAHRQREQVGDHRIPKLVVFVQAQREAYHDSFFLQIERTCVTVYRQVKNAVEIVHGFVLRKKVSVR